MKQHTSFVADHLGEIVLGAIAVGYAAGRSARKALDESHVRRDDALFASTRDQYDPWTRDTTPLRDEELTRYVA